MLNQLDDSKEIGLNHFLVASVLFAFKFKDRNREFITKMFGLIDKVILINFNFLMFCFRITMEKQV